MSHVRSLRSRLLALATAAVIALGVTGLAALPATAATAGAGVISGTVTDADSGAALQGASVTVTNDDYSVYESATTAADGTYTLESVPAGAYTVSASGPYDSATPYADAEKAVTVAGDSTQDFALKPTYTLSGKIVGDDGTAAAGVYGTLKTADGGELDAYLDIAEDGTFTTELPKGEYSVELGGSGYVDTTLPFTVSGADDAVTFEIPRLYAVSGKVLDPSGAVAYEAGSTSLTFVDSKGTEVDSAYAEEDGTWTTGEYGGIPAGTYTLKADNPAYVPTSTEITVETEAKTGANITLDAGITVTGKVTHKTTGDPIAGVDVRVSPTGEDSKAWGYAVNDGATAEDGTYKIQGLSAEEYELYLTTYDLEQPWVAVESQTVTLTESIEKNFELVLEERIMGVVTGPDGAPIEGASVVAYRADIDRTNIPQCYDARYATTDAEGQYTLLVDAGDWIVRAEGVDGFIPAWHGGAWVDEAATVSVASEQTVDGAGIALQTGGHRISGTVSNLVEGSEYSSVTVYSADDSRSWLDSFGNGVEIGADGKYSLTGVPAGSYEIRASSSTDTQHNSAITAPFTVDGDETIDVALQENPAFEAHVWAAEGAPTGKAVLVTVYANVDGAWQVYDEEPLFLDEETNAASPQIWKDLSFPAGEYKIGVGSAHAYYEALVNSVYCGEQQTTWEELNEQYGEGFTDFPYTPEFYNEAASLDAAQVVTFAAGTPVKLGFELGVPATPAPSETPAPSQTPAPSETPAPTEPTDPVAEGPEPGVTVSDNIVSPGERITVTGAGFVPGEDVRVEMHSTPVVLDTVTASADGTITAVVTIPSDATAGAHQIVATGSGFSAAADITVVLSGGLAATGAEGTLLYASLGGLVLAAGIVLLVVAYNKRRQLATRV
ncbi:hypothetical protein E4U02_01295 [Microbacterium paludicola]|uniref:Alpha-amylase n=1 Tax=Microbacterium paludicola TaxID=300019 RepID=A0A4Y9G0X0_9MICO|nr:carboxypeptidase regulatory-like domain-containing protein [Microbacterium paludicola]MBF0815043.1 carboxypeptidase regulatory-like domain-containing protein [Microbacterium paludicola]TFU34320.1 hypothetical protein E4U02_01295 [Microbacterium paludicola]